MAFIDQVQDLTSLTASDTDELSQFLRDGAIDVTSRWLAMKPQDVEDFARESSETTSNASLDLSGAKIISVIREDGVTSNNWRPCRKISTNQQYLVTDTESLSFASKFNPVYMIGDNGKISVFPAPGADPNAFKAYYVNNVPEESDGSTLRYTSTSIKYFPDDKVYLVIMYAGIKLLHATLAAKSAPAVPVLLEVPTLNITTTTPTAISLATVSYTDAANADASATAVGAITVTSPNKADISGDIPTYTKPTMVLGAAPTISNLSISAVSPVTPSLTSVTFTSIDSALDASAAVFSTATVGSASTYTGSAPAYTKPTIVLGAAPTISDLSINAVPPDVPTQTTTLPTYEEADESISDGSIEAEISKLQDYIEDEEDVDPIGLTEDGGMRLAAAAGDQYEDDDEMVTDKQIAEEWIAGKAKPESTKPLPEKDDDGRRKATEIENLRGEKAGWEMKEGTNFWSINEKDPYWKTQEGYDEAVDLYGTKPSFLKEKDVATLVYNPSTGEYEEVEQEEFEDLSPKKRPSL